MMHAIYELFGALFGAWRRLLTAVARRVDRCWSALRRAGLRWAAGSRSIRAYVTDTTSAWAEGSIERLEPAAAFGLRALIAGLIASTGIALGTGTRLAAVGLVVLTELLLAAARLAIVLLVVPAGTSRPRLLLAFAAGLAPYAFGVTPLLRLGSLWASGVLTFRGLRGAGVGPRDAKTATAWAFGGQTAIVVAGLLIRSVLALLGSA